MFYKILVAIDQSDLGEQLMEKAITIAKPIDAQLMLLNVASPFYSGYPDPPVYPMVDSIYQEANQTILERYEQEVEAINQQGLDLLRSQQAIATQAGVETEITQSFGDPGHVICDVARNWQADLIIIGRRGLSGWKEMILGSVSNYVIHHAPCSVLTVQPLLQSTPEAPHIAQVHHH
ncbi:hypothetical protein NIES2135_63180 (plasmid) [Leptolyngbya boryana NIES-2135]|jgi:nucleotide-binding universal stress UspA family protein|uniref:UspA domain-containing protein n=1 Tax=Leptolyngbya boryana NIES-2135 TaxID=1973484 RepID=A0A1Z4JRR1_LEPBY|nr:MULTISPECIES: universal stress protein [Leptolyngbya]BAY59441.1 hypothetical protein NIES2135_63180 [Leptolyngbya boryana NIES-2135]MBD2373025.1 universal stress protein [Leptolyngbya sp. FACHB-238]MBD2397221.1 universal stress protein [Leptolyngbya sp. FACHB-239]MBD2403973.1 universal stress protein [Leptolyngbya sp. FACHB-402]ULP33269.1 universal stress protein [Leptolyngbya boryana IU 594]